MERRRTRPTILLVEDYGDSRQMMTLLLEGMGYRVLPAANGREALIAAAHNDIDLVLTDFNLPDTTGPNVARYVRALGNQLAHIPVVIVTAFDGYEFRSLATEAGCDAFFIKPPDFDILKATVDRLLKVYGRKKDMVGVSVDRDRTNAALN